MDSAIVGAARAQFSLTLMFHYLFPILTMGLGTLIAFLKTLEYFKKDERYGIAARFWTHIFAINFAFGVVTGIPMEFQFGTNWATFSGRAGDIVGQPLAMESAYAFFLESIFLGVLLFGEHRVRPVVHWLSSILVAAGSLFSGYIIVVTNAWMQHPVGYKLVPGGEIRLTSLMAVLLNPFAGWQAAHTIMGSLVTASMVMAGIGAFYTLSDRHRQFARLSLRVGIILGLLFSLLQVYPTGDANSANVTVYQPIKLATMEGLFHTEKGASLAIIGMPDEDHERLLDPVIVPRLLSFLAYGNADAQVKGLSAYPSDLRPPMAITYYMYHIMIGLGSLFIALMGFGLLLLLRGSLFRTRWFLWALMLAIPFPYIANEAGWVVSEVGRQPWIIYGLMRTAAGVSPNVSAGEIVFTLLGFTGLYCVLGLLFVFLVGRRIAIGPEDDEELEEHPIPPQTGEADW